MSPLPPLVDLGPELSAAQVERYSRHLLVPGIGMPGQRRLLNARVCVVGAGGLGCPALLYLAAAGVGHLTVIDHDVVEVSNLQRQVLHRTRDVGAPKVHSAARAIAELNPTVSVQARHTEVTDETVDELIAGHDIVLDGTDNFTTRYVVNDACVARGVPLVWGAVLRFDAQVATFVPAPFVPADEAVHLRDLFPSCPPPEAVPSCADAGVLGAMCGQVGAIMATEAIKVITGSGRPLAGRVLLIDAAGTRTREISLRPSLNPVPGPGGDTAHTVEVPRPQWPEVSAAELVRDLEEVTVVDVREPPEHALGTIPGAMLVPLADLLAWQDVARLGPGPVVLTCKTGPRAERAAAHLAGLGHRGVRLLTRGMLGWIEDVDPDLPRY